MGSASSLLLPQGSLNGAVLPFCFKTASRKVQPEKGERKQCLQHEASWFSTRCFPPHRKRLLEQALPPPAEARRSPRQRFYEEQVLSPAQRLSLAMGVEYDAIFDQSIESLASRLEANMRMRHGSDALASLLDQFDAFAQTRQPSDEIRRIAIRLFHEPSPRIVGALAELVQEQGDCSSY